MLGVPSPPNRLDHRCHFLLVGRALGHAAVEPFLSAHVRVRNSRMNSCCPGRAVELWSRSLGPLGWLWWPLCRLEPGGVWLLSVLGSKLLTPLAQRGPLLTHACLSLTKRKAILPEQR